MLHESEIETCKIHIWDESSMIWAHKLIYFLSFQIVELKNTVPVFLKSSYSKVTWHMQNRDSADMDIAVSTVTSITTLQLNLVFKFN